MSDRENPMGYGEVVRHKKLIEVALPLNAINKACMREKSIRHGHPSTLHLWWARRPLAAARAVIFSQMIDDPSSHPERFPTSESQEQERQRLFRLIEALVEWEGTENSKLLEEARNEIDSAWRITCAENAGNRHAECLFDVSKPPAFYDPFAGGGALPLEAQRLGLDAYASDLNPVAVLINRAMIEIPPRFADKNPVYSGSPNSNPLLQHESSGARALAEDVRYYGHWIRDEAEKRIGSLYPRIEITQSMSRQRPELKALIGHKLVAIAWLWARTVKSPNPAFSNVDVPLVSTFVLSARPGKESYVQPIVERDRYRFEVRTGVASPDLRSGTKLGRGANFRCLISGTPIEPSYVYSEAKAGRMRTRLMAIVADGPRGRIYLSPSKETEEIADQVSRLRPHLGTDLPMPDNPRWFSPPLYGIMTFGDLFTQRQILALTTFSDLLKDAHEKIKHAATVAGFSNDGITLQNGGTGATAYADALIIYLAFVLDKCADYWSSVCSWHNSRELIRNTFGRQAIPMVWDFAEANPFSASTGNFVSMVDWVASAIATLPAAKHGRAFQADAATQDASNGKVVSTDPPYYDNIGYADLSDFFYVWLRRSLRDISPDLFTTLSTPKAEELIATPYRHGGREQAEAFFFQGMTKALGMLGGSIHPAFPLTIFYAFKQAETETDAGTASTGWETFLGAVVGAGLAISGTWPMRTELGNRMIASGTNALASSIVLVCRPRPKSAPKSTRREFLSALKEELPIALAHLQHENIAPVDLAQAAIGPGMAIYTRYSAVVDAEGNELSIRNALAAINQTLDEVLAEREGDFDPDTRWAVAWFDQYGFSEGEYGVAETLARAKNTSMPGLVSAGILAAKAGKVQLFDPSGLRSDWDPSADSRLTAWESVHHLIRVVETQGEGAAALLIKKLGTKAEVARELAYRLYSISERKGRSSEALSYNSLVQSWPEIIRLSRDGDYAQSPQPELFAGN